MLGPALMLNYRQIIQSEFSQRQRKNPQYSMRGFARDLGISQSFLSQVLNQKRKLSDERALLISQNLKFAKSYRNLFVHLVRLEQAQQEEARHLIELEIHQLLKSQVHYGVLSEQVFNVIADWYYFAMLELTRLPNFKCEPVWISKKLNISVKHAGDAIETLKSLELISLVNGRWQKALKNYIFEKVPSLAIKKHHLGTLSLAQRALTTQSLDDREFFTVCFAMDPLKIPRAKVRIREFCDSLMEEMEASEPKTVYKLAVQFFRLDKSASQKGELT